MDSSRRSDPREESVIASQSEPGHASGGERIVVGVFPGQPDAVVLEAATIALRFGAELICAWVDESRYAIEEAPDGTVRSMPMDPDLGAADDSGLPPTLTGHLAQLLDPTGVRWSARELVGDTARALGHLAELVGAAMIVVGTRAPGMKGSLHEFLTGSTAVHLAHRQHRPVVVVPLSPVASGDPLPWEPR